jgi:hypothetical protein
MIKNDENLIKHYLAFTNIPIFLLVKNAIYFIINFNHKINENE